MLFGCGVPAPHGGLYLLPLAEKPWLLLASLVIGSVLTATLLAVLKKPVPEGQSQ